mgnify:FL=1
MSQNNYLRLLFHPRRHQEISSVGSKGLGGSGHLQYNYDHPVMAAAAAAAIVEENLINATDSHEDCISY